MSDEDDPGRKGIEAALHDIEEAEGDVQRARKELARAEEELEEAVEELKEAEHGHGEHLVAVSVDGVEHKVRAGEWVVRDLKAKLGVDAAKVLAEITPHGLQDLNDDAEVKVREGLKFMTHARSGGSS